MRLVELLALQTPNFPIFLNPEPNEIEQIVSQSKDKDRMRGLLFRNGDLFAFPPVETHNRAWRVLEPNRDFAHDTKLYGEPYMVWIEGGRLLYSHAEEKQFGDVGAKMWAKNKGLRAWKKYF